MSFKYRFILSFVSIEIFFILLIVSMNFYAINSSSKQLTQEKISSNISLIDELIKVPISVYDLATLDNIVTNSAALEHINSIVILDNQDRILSSQFNFNYLTKEDIISLKYDKSLKFDDKTFEVKYSKVYDDNIFLGTNYIIFDTTANSTFIENMQNKTLLIIFFEILFSTILSYLIGNALTKKLTNLSLIAQEIGKNKIINIPYLELKDEIGILSNSLSQMQKDLKTRNNKLKKLAKTLNSQKQELIENQKYKDSFFANMSHELKTPLNSINILSSLMKKNKDNNLTVSQIKNMEIINKCGKHLTALINDILDISKLEAKEIILQTEIFDFKGHVLEIKEMFESQILEKNLQFDFKYDENVMFIKNDKKLISQIIINLLSNAIKFASKGKIGFIVSNKDEYIEIIISDQGIGIANDKLSHIFDRFKQVDGSTSRKFGGTGLGLAICKELVSLLQGSIEVSSEINVGSEFKVLIKKNIEDSNTSIDENKQIIKHIQTQNKPDIEVEKKCDDVVILNNDPIKFFDVIVELKRNKKNITQVDTLEALENHLIKNQYIVFVLDIILIEESELDRIANSYPNIEIFIICESKNDLNENIKQKVKKVFEKPLNKKELISSII
jgi:signal transduction histidine kinase